MSEQCTNTGNKRSVGYYLRTIAVSAIFILGVFGITLSVAFVLNDGYKGSVTPIATPTPTPPLWATCKTITPPPQPVAQVTTVNATLQALVPEDGLTVADFIMQENPSLTTVDVARIVRSVEMWAPVYKHNPRIIYAMMFVESDFRVTANSYLGPTSGRGLMQVSDIVRKDFNLWTGKKYTKADMYRIEKNIEVACWALRQNHYYGVPDDDFLGSIIAYNTGAAFYLNNSQRLLENSCNGKFYNYHGNVAQAIRDMEPYL